MMHKHAKSNTFSGNYYVTQKQRQRETLLLCAHEKENTEDEVDFGFFFHSGKLGVGWEVRDTLLICINN